MQTVAVTVSIYIVGYPIIRIQDRSFKMAKNRNIQIVSHYIYNWLAAILKFRLIYPVSRISEEVSGPRS
jgi:hypothetical protein